MEKTDEPAALKKILEILNEYAPKYYEAAAAGRRRSVDRSQTFTEKGRSARGGPFRLACRLLGRAFSQTVTAMAPCDHRGHDTRSVATALIGLARHWRSALAGLRRTDGSIVVTAPVRVAAKARRYGHHQPVRSRREARPRHAPARGTARQARQRDYRRSTRSDAAGGDAGACDQARRDYAEIQRADCRASVAGRVRD